MAESDTKVDNGVNVQALLDAREALTGAPAGAKFQWRATCEWKNGTHSHATIEGFFGLGEEMRHKKVFNFDADHPECFALNMLRTNNTKNVAQATWKNAL